MKKDKNVFSNSLLRSTALVKMVGAVLGVFCQIIDGILITRCLGPEAMSSYGLAMPLMFVNVAFGGMIATGIQIVIGNAIGKGDKDTINKAYTTCIIFSVLFATLVGVLSFVFAKPIAEFLGAKGDAASLLEGTVDYIRGYAICAPVGVLQIVIIVFLMFDGKGSLVSAGAIVLLIVDVVGDILAVYVFKNGLFGMALASSISVIASVLVMCLYFFNKNKLFKFVGLKIDFRILWKSIVNGLSFLSKQLSNIMRALILNKIIILVVKDVSTLAVLSVVSTVRTLVFCAIGGIGEAVYMISNILITENDKKGLRNTLYASRKQTFLFGLPLTAIVIGLSGPIASVFNKCTLSSSWSDPTAIALMLFFISVIPYSFQYIYRNYLMALKRNGQVYTFTILNEFVFPCAIAAIGGALFSTTGFFLSFAISEGITVLAMTIGTLILKKKDTPKNEIFMQYPSYLKDYDELAIEFNSSEEVCDFSKKVYDFAMEKTNDKKKAYSISLCVEELGENIVKFGIKKKSNRGYIRVIDTEDFISLRIRDNCNVFNPLTYMKQLENNNEDKLGLKMLVNLADNIEYMNSLKTNNIVLTLKKGNI